jgi:hypothetical protein
MDSRFDMSVIDDTPMDRTWRVVGLVKLYVTRDAVSRPLLAWWFVWSGPWEADKLIVRQPVRLL